MDTKSSIRDLINKLNNLTKAYDEGNPLVSDKEWDELYYKLQYLEMATGIVFPDSPTQCIHFQTVSKLVKVKHNHPMLSLAKTKDINTLSNFINDKQSILMLKMDGLTLSLKYVNGRLVSAETRGNGEEGEDVLHNAKIIESIPNNIPYKSDVIIDGEIICKTDIFAERFASRFRNSRNYAAGAIRRLSAKENNIDDLTFIAWDWVNGPYETLSQRLDFLGNNLGFLTVPFVQILNLETINLSSCIEELKQKAEELGYPIDGMVAKYDNCEYYQSLGATEHHFNGGLAYKFYDEEYETKLRYIDYDVSRNGILTPVAVFEPIDIDGSTVERASLHNISVMFDTLGVPFEGEKIWVIKSNMIIPQITRAEINEHWTGTHINVQCPICGEFAQLKRSDSGVLILYCPNDQCQGKLAQRIDYYCSKKGLDIKGLSRATIEKLIDWGWIENIIDIYKLHSHQMEWMDKPGFGKASVFKILDAIDESRENTKLDTFISAIGIPLVGKSIAKIICKQYYTWQDFRDAVGGDWSELEGIGPEISKAINSFNYTEADEIVKLINIVQEDVEIVNVNSNISGKIFVITGRLDFYKNRELLKAEIESLGGKVTSSVSSKTDYLINNDTNSESSKNVQAKKLGITIITESEYLKMKEA